VFLTSCSTVEANCSQTARCTARGPLEKIREDILRLLDSITIEEMSAGGREAAPLVKISAARAIQ
jgi:DNA-binding IscR family transcriptional regulator